MLALPSLQHSMFPAIIRWRRRAWLNFALQKSCRCMTTDHLTFSEKQMYFRHLDAKYSHRPLDRIPQGPANPQPLQPDVYDTQSSAWIAFQDRQLKKLQPGKILKAISWNLLLGGLDPAARASAALEYLRACFGRTSKYQVFMFQEVTLESLQAILDNPWVQRNFILSDVRPPDSLYKDIPGENFIMKQLRWKAARCFTLMMVSRDMGVADCFRVPFVTKMGRDVLVVDLPVSDEEGNKESASSIRLCTTHLESSWRGRILRPGQLALVADLLKDRPATRFRPIAGLVGGDMNAVELADHALHREKEIDLKDVWEDVSAPPIPVRKPSEKDLTYGRARGHTWGYHSDGARKRKRLDKFFYTGSIETVALKEAQDVAGKQGRFGIGIKTEVEAWEMERREIDVVRGKSVERLLKKHYSDDTLRSMLHRGGSFDPPPVWTKIDTWVSDHFGIGVGVRIPYPRWFLELLRTLHRR